MRILFRSDVPMNGLIPLIHTHDDPMMTRCYLSKKSVYFLLTN